MIQKLLADAEAALQAERAAGQAAQPASPQTVDLAPVVEKAFGAEIAKQVAEQVQKALAESREGVGRSGVSGAPSGPTLESDPVAYLIKKAESVDFDDPYALTVKEKETLVGLWNATMWGDPNPGGDR